MTSTEYSSCKSGIVLRIGKRSLNDPEYLPVEKGCVL